MAGITLAFTSRMERDELKDMAFPHALSFFIALAAAFVLIENVAGRSSEKSERYDEILADWRAGMKKEAVERIENYVWLDSRR